MCLRYQLSLPWYCLWPCLWVKLDLVGIIGELFHNEGACVWETQNAVGAHSSRKIRTRAVGLARHIERSDDRIIGEWGKGIKKVERRQTFPPDGTLWSQTEGLGSVCLLSFCFIPKTLRHPHVSAKVQHPCRRLGVKWCLAQAQEIMTRTLMPTTLQLPAHSPPDFLPLRTERES